MNTYVNMGKLINGNLIHDMQRKILIPENARNMPDIRSLRRQGSYSRPIICST